MSVQKLTFELWSGFILKGYWKYEDVIEAQTQYRRECPVDPPTLSTISWIKNNLETSVNFPSQERALDLCNAMKFWTWRLQTRRPLHSKTLQMENSHFNNGTCYQRRWPESKSKIDERQLQRCEQNTNRMVSKKYSLQRYRWMQIKQTQWNLPAVWKHIYW